MTANRLIPTGGVITEISMSFTSTIPNQIGSMPSATVTG